MLKSPKNGNVKATLANEDMKQIWNRLVKVSESFNSYEQILKKHTRDIVGSSKS